jgi:AcrR family transcriptional regulator
MDDQQISRYERRKQRTRQAIKAAAAELLVEKGYEPLTIQDITDHLDLARATFYIYFRDKDEVIWELLQEKFDALYARVIDELPKDSHDRHYQKLLRIFEYAQQNRDLMKILLGNRGHISLTRKLADYLVSIIEKDIKSGLTQHQVDAPISFTARFLAGAMIQTMIWWFETDNNYSPEQVTRMFYELEIRPDKE